MRQLRIQPPVVTYDQRGYSFLYATYLHATAALLRSLVSYASGIHDGFDKDIFIDTPGLGNGKAKISICLPDNYDSKPRPMILVLEGGGFVLGEPKDGKKNDRRLAQEVCGMFRLSSANWAESAGYSVLILDILRPERLLYLSITLNHPAMTILTHCFRPMRFSDGHCPPKLNRREYL